MQQGRGSERPDRKYNDESRIPDPMEMTAIDIAQLQPDRLIESLLEIARNQGFKTEDKVVDKLAAVLTEVEDRRSDILEHVLHRINPDIPDSQARRSLTQNAQERLRKALDIFEGARTE